MAYKANGMSGNKTNIFLQWNSGVCELVASSSFRIVEIFFSGISPLALVVRRGTVLKRVRFAVVQTYSHHDMVSYSMPLGN